MIIKQLLKEDNINYKKQSLFIGFPTCTWKCEFETGCRGMCQNSTLALAPNICVSCEELIAAYKENPLNEAVVCGGLEPIDSWDELFGFIRAFRKVSDDDIVIYTGYNKNEIMDKVQMLKDNNIPNIIIKFGRYKPNEEKHFDEVLGVNLASSNQYAEKVS